MSLARKMARAGRKSRFAKAAAYSERLGARARAREEMAEDSMDTAIKQTTLSDIMTILLIAMNQTMKIGAKRAAPIMSEAALTVLAIESKTTTIAEVKQILKDKTGFNMDDGEVLRGATRTQRAMYEAIDEMTAAFFFGLWVVRGSRKKTMHNLHMQAAALCKALEERKIFIDDMWEVLEHKKFPFTPVKRGGNQYGRRKGKTA